MTTIWRASLWCAWVAVILTGGTALYAFAALDAS